MDFTNINDPAGVQALLEQLRTSQAWQELKQEPGTNPSNPHPPDIPHPSGAEVDIESSPVVSDQISSLLSQLQPGTLCGPSSSASGSWTPHRRGFAQSMPHVDPPHENGLSLPDHRISSLPLPKKYKRLSNFNQALPIIARLSEDDGFMEKLKKLREEQIRLEKKLWEERNQILKSQEEKVRVAKTKASMISTALSQKDAMVLQTSFEKELEEFDREQVLVAWDALLAKQQDALEKFGVPNMFATNEFSDREKQQRIIQVLDGLFEPAEDDDVEE